MNAEQAIGAYFAGEKSEALLILVAGGVCLIAAAWLWFWVREPFARGLAATLLLTAFGFTIDFYAEARAVQYVHALDSAGALARE